MLTLVLLVQLAFTGNSVKADDSVMVEINGYQISTTLEAFRTIYSVSDPANKVAEVGLIYGLKDYSNEKDMVVNSSDKSIFAYKATSKGLAPFNYGTKADCKSYVRSMIFTKTAKFYLSQIMVRAYVKLKDNTYSYSNVLTTSVYDIADYLYQKSLMANEANHQYLYDNILAYSNSDYKAVKYEPKSTVLPTQQPTTQKITQQQTTQKVTQQPTTQKPTQTPTTQKPTQAPTTQKPTQKPTQAPTTQQQTTNPKDVDHIHTYVTSTVKNATETADGEKKHQCSFCNDSYTTVIPATNKDLIATEYDGIDADSSSSVGNGNETSNKLFDKNTGTKVYIGSAGDIRIAWKMKQAVYLKSYALVTANDTATYTRRNPKKWQLLGSNDATTWTQIDRVEDSGMTAENFKEFGFDPDIKNQAFKYYMIHVDNTYGDGLQLSEIKMKGAAVEPGTDINPGNLNKFTKGVYASANTISGYGNETASNLFDNNTATKLFSTSKGTIAWELTKDTTVYSYSLITANDNAKYTGRNPRSWKAYGSKNGQNWEVIDHVADSQIENKNYTRYTYQVDKIGTYKYLKIEFERLDSGSFQLSGIETNGAFMNPSKYDIMFAGDWDLIKDKNYVNELVKLFYMSYPRLNARWGKGNEPKTITFRADKSYDGVAYSSGTTVCVSTTYANNNPHDIGFFSHEITHSVQQYGSQINYDEPSWWIENMANYGGFRYFHWSNPDYVQVYFANDTSLQDWGWQKYGNNKWFFAYMDARYPTKMVNGQKKEGLIDAINTLIKGWNKSPQLNDSVTDSSSEMNKIVKSQTGYDNFEELRKHYVDELKNKTWTFTGFKDYQDNWITENIEGLDNPDYPEYKGVVHGNKTAAKISNVTSGTNLMSGATIMNYSGFQNDNERPEKLIDGNLGTKWCASKDKGYFGRYALEGAVHWVQIDLGSEKTFNTYTIHNTKSAENFGNATEWEILISNDKTNWTSLDYQPNGDYNIASYNVGNQKARYVMMKVFNPESGGSGTLRMYEFSLYNK